MPLPTSQNIDNMFNGLVAVLKTVTDPNNTAQPLFSNTQNTTNPLGQWEIYDGTVTEYQGTPAAILEPADGPQSEFATSAENYRGYGYYIFIHMDTTPTNYFQSRKNMRLIVDSILDSLDRSGMLAGAVDIMQAATFRWLKENTAAGINIVAPILVTAQKTVEIG